MSITTLLPPTQTFSTLSSASSCSTFAASTSAYRTSPFALLVIMDNIRCAKSPGSSISYPLFARIACAPILDGQPIQWLGKTREWHENILSSAPEEDFGAS